MTTSHDFSHLLAADVVLYHSDSLPDLLIEAFDHTCVAHAGLLLGRNQLVGEVLPEGLSARKIQISMEKARHIVIKRMDIDYVSPVASKALSYVSRGAGYAYDPQFLLAFLALGRKIRLNRYTEPLLRKIFEGASEFLSRLKPGTSNEKQPMLCSELVYRCYQEAVENHNPYHLNIAPFHPPEQPAQNLLGWFKAKARRVECQNLPDPEPLKAELEELGARYLEEDGEEFIISRAEERLSPGLFVGINNFSEHLNRFLFKDSPLQFKKLNGSLGLMENMVSDLVSPGDLWRSPSLNQVCVIPPESEAAGETAGGI